MPCPQPPSQLWHPPSWSADPCRPCVRLQLSASLWAPPTCSSRWPTLMRRCACRRRGPRPALLAQPGCQGLGGKAATSILAWPHLGTLAALGPFIHAIHPNPSPADPGPRLQGRQHAQRRAGGARPGLAACRHAQGCAGDNHGSGQGGGQPHQVRALLAATVWLPCTLWQEGWHLARRACLHQGLPGRGRVPGCPPCPGARPAGSGASWRACASCLGGACNASDVRCARCSRI